jgi:hypothetical protein
MTAVAPVLVRDPKESFTEDNLKKLIGQKYEGADSKFLRDAMSNLAENPQGKDLDAALDQIAAARRRPVSEIRAEYQKYLQVRQEADAKNPGGFTALNTWSHPRFMGSTSQLRSGKVVGDAFGIDPVFGALLNPTGGLVGPGNAALDCGDTAVGYHGAVHDAGGYLRNNHRAGPGYDYLGKERRDPSSPLSGQREGIHWWRDKLGGWQHLSVASEIAISGVVGVKDAIF